MVRPLELLPFVLAAVSTSRAAGVLLKGGTIVAFNRDTQALRVVRGGSLLVREDRIAGIYEADDTPSSLPEETETVDVTGKIITPGFIDTHRHGWQTAFKTIASNVSLAEYFFRYGEFASAGSFTAEDVYVGQLAGLYEALNAGVTTTLDHAHSTWSDETSAAGLSASIDSGARVFYGYTFHTVPDYTVSQQLVNFRALAKNSSLEGSPTTLAVAYDSWVDPTVQENTQGIIDLIKEQNISVVTTHSLQGPWGYTNSPEELNALGLLNSTTAYVFSHASFLTFAGATVLRNTDQHISITPESEFHYGHTDPVSHLIQDQASLGVDTHFTFSTDILTQARLWLQTARYRLYAAVLDVWRIPRNNPMSVNQAFLLATRNGARALRQDDIGIIAEGAKADLVVWNGDSPALLGWVDPVAAVILHASVGDVLHVLVDGKWKKRNGTLAVDDYDGLKERFLASARRIQQAWRERPPADLGEEFPTGTPYATTVTVDVQHGDGTGYGQTFV